MTEPFAVPFLPRRPRTAYRDRIPGRRSSGDARGWHKGWPEGMAAADMKAVIAIRPQDGREFRVRVDKRLAELVAALLAAIQEVGYPLIGALEVATKPGGGTVKQGGVGSYNNRPIKTNDGTEVASEHSRGLALDLWSRSNPQRWSSTGNAPFSSTWHPLAVRLAIAAGFEWGAHFWDLKPEHSYIDAMHIEYRWSPEDVANSIAQLKDEYRRIQDELKPPAPPEDPDVTPKEIMELQAALNAAGTNPPLLVDGDYGPLTRAAVNALPGTVQAQVDIAELAMRNNARDAAAGAIDELPVAGS